ncbi:hypothetical protein J5X84_29735 [Streptosporangiaceae bacterium NEAU-GS5]|nr:hypothetical protein [Streptosporangiaceae bacterium NEAU-GS5]
MTGDTHYDLETLAEFAEGLLDDASARGIREHLAVCDPCGEGLADLSTVRELLAAVPTPAMPLGVAMRIDQALAAERTVLIEQPVTLGVVDDDGQVVRKRAARRRWGLPVGMAAAAAVVVGSTAIAANVLLSAQGPTASGPGEGSVAAAPTKTQQRAGTAVAMFASGHNYTSKELSGPLVDYFSAAPGNYGSAEDLDSCVKRRSSQLNRRPIAVDKAQYNGNEATIMVFWKDQVRNTVQVVVVDSACKSLRKAATAAWK